MKNLFAIYKRNDENNFSSFIVRSISSAREKEKEALFERGEKLSRRILPPQWLAYAALIAMPVGLLFTFGIVFAKDGFTSALENRGYLFYLGIGIFALGLFTFIYTRIAVKMVEKNPRVASLAKEADKTIQEAMEELEIPLDAKRIDILFPVMKKNKKGEEVPAKGALVQVLNQELYLFLENGNLCFSDADVVVSVPLDRIKGIKRINERIALPKWNKEEKIKSPKYSPYGLYTNQAGFVLVEPYYEVFFVIEEEEYCFDLPSYEKDEFLNLLGKDIPVI